MIINFKRKQRIKELKERLEYLDDCLEMFDSNKQSQVSHVNLNIINNVIQTLSKSKKREFSLSLKKELGKRNINLTYEESNLIYDYLKIGHIKLYLNSYLAYHKLINRH